MITELIAALSAAPAIAVIGFALEVIAGWRIFQKMGKPGWHSVIPLLHVYDRYDAVWEGVWGVVLLLLIGGVAVFGSLPGMSLWADILTVAAAILELISLQKLSKSFARGHLFTLGLILLRPVFLLILALDESRYHGPCIR